MVLSKSKGLSNAAAGALAGQTHQRVMHWVRRFQEKGLDGLKTASGRGRKRKLQKTDEQAVRDAISKHRQSVSKACAALEKATGKKVSDGTLRNFLTVLAQDLGV